MPIPIRLFTELSHRLEPGPGVRSFPLATPALDSPPPLTQVPSRRDSEQPLIDEAERAHQLATKLANKFSFRENTYPETLSFQHEVKTHVDVEIEVEKRLRMEGYLPATINRTRTSVTYYFIL